MKTFFIDITTDEQLEKSGREIQLKATSRFDAMERVKSELKEDEWVYQIRVKRPGCDLPQPVYDYFNGFSIYKD